METAIFRPQLNSRFMFRWEPSQDAFILLYPEGLIKLNPSAGEILKRCDGQRTVDEIVADLQATFPDNPEGIAQGTSSFLAVARDKGWLRS